MKLYAVPSTDEYVQGTWVPNVGSDLFAVVNEGIDGSPPSIYEMYVISGPDQGDQVYHKLTGVLAPGPEWIVSIAIHAQRVGTSSDTITLGLYREDYSGGGGGGTPAVIVAEETFTINITGWTTYTLVLSPEEIQDVVSWSDLWVCLSIPAATLSTIRVAAITMTLLYAEAPRTSIGESTMNLGGLATEAQRLAGRVDAGFTQRTKNWINEAIQRWTTKDPLGLLRDEISVVSDGTKDLFMPSHVAKVCSVFDQTRKLPVRRTESWDLKAPNQLANETEGNPYWWRDLGYSPIGCNFTNAIGSAGDAVKLAFIHPGEAAVCYVEGLVEQIGGLGPGVMTARTSEYVTAMSGSYISSSNAYVQVLTIGKSAQTSGRVTACWYDGGSTYEPAAVIGATEGHSKYRRIQLLYKPPAGNEFKVRYVRRVERLQEDNEMPPPFINEHFLIWWAAGNIHSAMKEMDNAREKWSMAEKFLAEDAHHEEAYGDQDTSSIPDVALWGVGEEEGWTP